jgi:lysine-specific demethylase 8
MLCCTAKALHDASQLASVDHGLLKLRQIRRIKQLAWEKLHCGNWRTVPVAWRHLYALCARLELWLGRHTLSFIDFVSGIDLALLLGHPRDAACCQRLLHAHTQQQPASHAAPCTHVLPQTCTCSQDTSSPLPALDPLLKLPVQQLHLPSAAVFRTACVIACEPSVLTGLTAGWAAANSTAPNAQESAPAKWCHLAFWQRMIGHRRLPLELGAHYMSAEWTQRMLPGEALLQQMCTRGGKGGCPAHVLTDCSGGAGQQHTMYLAQHDVFAQVPQLAGDVGTPEYCLHSPHTAPVVPVLGHPQLSPRAVVETGRPRGKRPPGELQLPVARLARLV